MESVSQAPDEPRFVADPYVFYRSIRAKGDFVFWTDYGFPVATTAASVNAILRNPNLGRQVPPDLQQARPEALQAFYEIEAHSLLELEPPAHTRIRKALLGSFTRSHVQHSATAISQLADRLINDFPSGPFDLLRAFAQPLPALVISDILGVPLDMAGQLRAWSNAMVAMYQARRDATIEREANRAAGDFAIYVRDLLRLRKAEPRDDLISRLAHRDGAAGQLSEAEATSSIILLLNAGHEATVHTIGNAVRVLADCPDRTLALEPDNIAGTVDECLRFDPPLHMFTRFVYRDVTVLDQSFRKGDKIGCLLGSACHDDAVWPDSEVFDPFRLNRPNLAFGAGAHYCLGAPLALLELQIVLPALFSRCPDLRVVEQPKVANLYHFRGLEKLMVTV